MSLEVGKTEKKNQRGRKGKKAWRKNIDLDDVEQGLEEIREEERSGGIVNERADGALFMVDTAGDEKTKQKLKKKKLRIDEILEKRSSIAIPVLGSKMSEERRKRKAEHEAKRRLRRIAGLADDRRTAAERIKLASNAEKYDIWGAASAPSSDASTRAKSSRSVVSRHKLAHLASLPAVEVAHPGASYQPTKAAHKELIEKAAGVALRQLTELEHLQSLTGYRGNTKSSVLSEQAKIISADLEERKRLKESEGNDNEDSDSSDSDSTVDSEGEADENSNDDDDAQTIVGGSEERQTTKDPKRKTRAQRNRQKRAAEQEAEGRKRVSEKRKMHQLMMLRKLRKQVDKGSEEKEKEVERKRKAAEEKAKMPRKKLGKRKVPELPEAVKLPDELPSSLRQLKPESNAFSEAFNSLVKRNLVEPRAAGRSSKRNGSWKIKYTEKWSYKDFK